MLHLVKQIFLFEETDVFLPLNGKCLAGANGIYLHLETPKLQQVFLSKLTQFSQEKNVLDAPASNNEGLPRETHVFHHLPLVGLFEAQGDFLPFENFALQEFFLSKHNTSLIWKKGARCSCC